MQFRGVWPPDQDHPNRISPDAGFVTLAEIDDQTAIVERPVERPADEVLTPSDRRR
jgi:hypothetical protein